MAVGPVAPRYQVLVFHFLPSEYALINLALGRLKIATFNDLNDPFELLPNIGRPGERHAFTQWKEQMAKSCGVLCFSSSWENPVLWGHYAAKHKGMALGFEIPEKNLAKVRYIEHRVPANFNERDGDEELIRALLASKFKHWEYESEYRMFARLDPAESEDGLYFKSFGHELQLKEVILGAHCSVPVEAICSLVGRLYLGPNCDQIVIQKAALAYKWFTVVPGNTVTIAPLRQEPSD